MALALVTENGKTIAVQKLAVTPSDAQKPWRGPADQRAPVAASQSLKAVAIPLAGIGKMIDKKDIPANVTDFFLVTPELTTPDLSDYDEVVDEGTTSPIVKIIRLRPATVTLLYVIGVAR